MTKKVYIALALSFLATQLIAQTQERIPWPSLANSPWPVVRGDVQGTGRSVHVGPKNPEVLGKKTYPYGLITGPVIGEEGKLYFGTFAVNWINENYFYCTDSLGNEIWRFVTNSWVANDCAPAVASNGNIYFGSDNYKFYSLNYEGQLQWEYGSSSAFDVENLILDKLGNIYVGSMDSLYSFDSEGHIRFQLAIPGILASTLVFSPSGDTLYVRSVYYDHPKYIYHINSVSTTGEVYWKREFHGISNSFVVDNSNRIYLQGVDTSVTERSALFCLDSAGKVNWYYNEESFPDRFEGGPTIDHDGNVYFFGSLNDGGNGGVGITSLDYNGNLRWIYEIEIEPWFEYPWISVEHGLVCDAEGTIYVATALGHYLYAISSEGELNWKLRLKDYYVTSGPVIGGDGLIYLGMHHGSLANDLENNLWVIGEKISSVDEGKEPTEFTLQQNYPNPFNPSTTITFTIRNVGHGYIRPLQTKLIVYDILGREIKSLVNEVKSPGTYEVKFNGSDLSSGTYFYKITVGNFTQTKKMLLVK